MPVERCLPTTLPSVAQASGLDDHVDRADDHLLDGLGGQAIAAHGDHALDPADRLTRAVGVQRAHRAVVAGVHGLQEVERLGATDFADDDPLGTHPQTVLDQIPHGHRAAALEIGRTGFQAHHVRLLQLQFGGVLAGHDPLGGVDERGHGVEQRRLARTRTARDDEVTAAGADDPQNPRPFGTDGGELHQVLHGQLVLLELPDGQGRTIQRQGGRDHVDAAAVGQARIADRRAFIDPAADLADDPLADVHQLQIVAEADVRQLDLAAHFDEHPVRAVDHDVGDVVARQQRLQRAIAEDVVDDVLDQMLLLGHRHRDVLDRHQLGDDVADLLTGLLQVQLSQLGEVDGVQQSVEDRGLGGVVVVALLTDDVGRLRLALGGAQLFQAHGRLGRRSADLGRGGLGFGRGDGLDALRPRGDGRTARRSGGRRLGIAGG